MVRCDFNVPLDEQGDIVDDFRIQESTPTIQHARERGAKVILLAHLGRPAEEEGSTEEIHSKLSLRPVAQRLGEILGISVPLASDCVGEEVQSIISKMKNGDVVLLENLRFHEEEEENNEEFARALANLGELYINEAFAVDHRAHASLVGIPKFLPSAAGLLLEKEVEALGKVVKDPVRPVIVIIGGTKIESKIHFLEGMCTLADEVFTGNPVFNEIQ